MRCIMNADVCLNIMDKNTTDACLYICQSIYLYVCLSVCLHIGLSICQIFCLSICLPMFVFWHRTQSTQLPSKSSDSNIIVHVPLLVCLHVYMCAACPSVCMYACLFVCL